MHVRRTVFRPSKALLPDLASILTLFRYSGVAWAYSKEPEDITIVTSWPSKLNRCSDMEKTPTQLCFGTATTETTWGFGVSGEQDPIKWFKLLLLDGKDVPSDVKKSSQYQKAVESQKTLNKGPTELISCFLRNLWNHALDSIEREVGREELVSCRLHIVFTTPAIWPSYAQQRMKLAAKLSGILETRSAGATTLRFVSEPEAAALATLKDVSKRSTIKVSRLCPLQTLYEVGMLLIGIRLEIRSLFAMLAVVRW